MATALDIVRRSMRLIGVLAEGEVPTAEQASDALAALQGMIGEWETRGLRLGALVDSTIALSGDLPLPPTHLNAMVFNLAVAIAPEYGRSDALQAVVPQAERSFRALQGIYARAPTIAPDPAVVTQRGIIGNVGYGLPVWSDTEALSSDMGALYP